MKNTLYLIDGHAIAYRAYFAFIRNPLTNSRGENTSAVFGFLRLLLSLMKKYDPQHIAVAFDSGRETHRHEKFPQYKAQRESMPEDMSSQMPVIIEVLEAMGIPVLAEPGFEADDIIATLSRMAAGQGMDVRIVSSDKDLFQLLDDKIHLLRPSKGNELVDDLGPEYLEERFGLEPGQIVDLLALMGDSSDNIPGVKGIGEKTALKLLHQYGSLDSILEHAEEISPEGVSKKISAGRDDALFSRELVRLVDAPVNCSCDDLKKADRDERRLMEILLDMEFNQIVRELSLGSADLDESSGYSLVGEKDLERLARELEESGRFVLDVETTSLDPFKAELVGISFCTGEGKAWYVPVASERKADEDEDEGLFDEEQEGGYEGIPLDTVQKVLGPVLASESAGKTGHNIKYDLKVLELNGFEVGGVEWDTMIASYCVDPTRRSHSLDNLVLEFFLHRMIQYNDLFEKGDRKKDIRRVPVEKLCTYSCEDADYTFRLRKLMEKKLEETGTAALFSGLEMPLCLVLKRMELEGVRINAVRLMELSIEMAAELEEFEEAIFKYAGERFNINSNQQLQHVLFEKLGLPSGRKTKTGYSTDVRVLTQLAAEHPIAGAVLEFRQLSKLSSTYVDALPKLVNRSTGRVHTSFNQTVTATGRLSSSDPNLQNIPIRKPLGRKIRGAFVPREGNILIDADYSQIELRLLAHLSGDPELISAFREGSDIHTRTASRIYGVEEGEVKPEMRDAAKTINFGVIYGQGPRALSQQLRIPFEEAQEFIEEYFARYPGIGRFIEDSKEFARKNGYARTLMGRRRPLPDINSENGRFRSFSERIAVNTPIQGTAADLIKIAMIAIDREVVSRGLRSRMILQVHDELVFDVLPAEKDVMKELIRELMESAMLLDVPLKVEIGEGTDWLEAH